MVNRHLWLAGAMALLATPALAATVATPTFSPAGGTYSAPQYVTISTRTSGARIHYTTNGATPTTSSTVYAGPVAVTVTTTLKAIAVRAGYTNSTVATATYTIAAATPVISPPSGAVNAPPTVTITDATPGAAIYYTLDGTTPTTSSISYAGPFTVAGVSTIKAVAAAPGYATSAVATATYSYVAAAPQISPAGGSYGAPQVVTLSDVTPGATIYYTTNGKTPTTASTVYSGPFAVSSATTVKALAAAPGFANSAVASAAYTFVAATPEFSPAAGAFGAPLVVTISDATPGAAVYYTTNGTTPTTSSARYSGPLTLTGTTTVKAIAAAPGYTTSAVASATYTIVPPAPAPTLTPLPGSYPGPQVVVIADAAPGAQIHFTVDGTTPTELSPLYAAPIPVAGTTVLQAIAVAPGYVPSGVAGGTYVVAPPSPGAVTAVLAAAASTTDITHSLPVSTSTTDVLLLALVAAGGPVGSSQNVTVDGDLLWTRLETSSAQPGSAGIWWAVAPYPLTSAAVRTTAAVAGYTQVVTIIGIAGARLSPGTSLTGSGATGVPSLTLLASDAGSWFYAVGLDPTSSAARTAAPGQTIFAEVADPSRHTAAWAQLRAAAAASPGEPVELTVAAPTGDAWNFAAVEVVPARVAAPTFAPPPGTYDRPQAVALAAAAGAAIHYTTDGSEPTTTSPLYSAPVPIGSTTTVKAIASAAGRSTSTVASGTYAIVPAVAAIAVHGPAVPVKVGGFAQLTATATYTDSSARDITAQAVWTSSDTGVAAVSSGGVVTGVGAGTTTVSATIEGVTGEATVTIQPAPAGALYCYDAAGNLTARLACDAPANCVARCP